MSAPADPMSFRWAADLRRASDLLATKLALLLFRGGSVILPGMRFQRICGNCVIA